MKWANVHPRGLILLNLGRVGVVGLSLFPLNPTTFETCSPNSQFVPQHALRALQVTHILCPSFAFITYINNPKQGDYHIFILGLSQALSMFFLCPSQ